ncbi:hypothetical protein Tco_0825212 [Tanacetum coccineum]
MEKDIDKLVDGEDEESYANEFANFVFQDDDDDSDNRLELESHKENLETIDDDDENAKEKIQTPIPSPPRSPRTNLSSDKNVSQEMTTTVSPIADTTSQGHSKQTSINTKEKMREIPDLLKNLIPELTVAKTNELIKEAVPRLVNATITRDREIAPTNNTVLSLYPTTSLSTATTSTANIQHQLYLTMKANLQDQAADPELWEILKAKFETS